MTPVRRILVIALPLVAVAAMAACRDSVRPLYTIGVLELLESPTTADLRRGFIRALEEGGLRDGSNFRLNIRNAQNDISQAQRIAQGFAAGGVDLIVAVSTAGL